MDFCRVQQRIVLSIRRVAAEISGDGEERARRGGVNWQQSGPIDESDVVDADVWLGGENYARGGEERFGLALTSGDQRLNVANRAAEQ